MFPLDFNRNFESEANGHYRWYQARQLGLGRDFLDDLDELLNDIHANPARFALVTATIRQGMMSRFPFVVYYRTKPDRVRILALWHTARGSSAWKSRR